MNSELTDINPLRGFEAVQALDCYANRLETRKNRDLTKSQKEFLVRTARVLSRTISNSEECQLKKTLQ